MRALSLHQPWATLLVAGFKINETRSWPTSYRGPLAIHAAKKWSRTIEDLCFTEPFATYLLKLCPNQGGAFYLKDALELILPFGKIVGTVHVDDCVLVDERGAAGVLEPERSFGEFTPGRYRWPTSKPVRLAEPFDFVGRQGFFDVPDELVAAAGEMGVPGGLWG